MAKKIKAFVKLALPAGKATPAPPVGPALGQHGVNIAASILLAKFANAKKGAAQPNRENVGTVTLEQQQYPLGFQLALLLQWKQWKKK
eukprot:gene23642-32013_t